MDTNMKEVGFSAQVRLISRHKGTPLTPFMKRHLVTTVPTDSPVEVIKAICDARLRLDAVLDFQQRARTNAKFRQCVGDDAKWALDVRPGSEELFDSQEVSES